MIDKIFVKYYNKVMQKIITLALYEGKLKTNLAKTLQDLSTFGEQVEVIYHLYGGKKLENLPASFTSLATNDYSKFVKVAANTAKSTYFLCANCDLEVVPQTFLEFIKKLEKMKDGAIALNTPPMSHIVALRTTEIKRIAYDEDAFESSVYLLANVICSTRSCAKMDISPFKFRKGTELNYHTENFTRFKSSVDKFCEKFGEIRTKLSSSVYKVVFEMLSSYVAERYLCSLYLQICKRADGQEIAQYDEKIKNDRPFVYFSVAKNFVGGDLKKLRETAFAKVPFFTAQKIKGLFKNE
jgi:hypothetical protein